MPTAPLRLGIAGLGTVGVGVLKMLHKNAEMLSIRTGRQITVSAVSAKSKSKDRGVDLGNIAWEDNPVLLSGKMSMCLLN